MKQYAQYLTFFSLFTIIFFTGCSTTAKSKHELQTFDDFPVTINLSCEEIQTEANLWTVGGLILLDSILVSVDIMADTFFNVFMLPHFEWKGGFIRRGQGPEEEIDVSHFISRVSGNEFLYDNRYAVRIAKYNTNTNKLEIVERVKYPDNMGYTWCIMKFGDLIIGNRSQNIIYEKFSDQEFIGFNVKNNEKFDFGGEYPVMEKFVDPSIRVGFFDKLNVRKPDGSGFASVYDLFPILRIYSNEGKIEKEIRWNNGQKFPYALIEEMPSRESINEIMHTYRMIKSSNDYIYALYLGKKEHELSRGLIDFSNEIHVWNWEGKPIKRILLDKIIRTFDVDLHDNYLICSSLESLNALYKYNL
jgi:hypothetical protein